MLYRDIASGQSAPTGTTVDFTLLTVCGIHLRVISQRVPKPPFCKMNFQTVLINLLSHPSEAHLWWNMYDTSWLIYLGHKKSTRIAFFLTLSYFNYAWNMHTYPYIHISYFSCYDFHNLSKCQCHLFYVTCIVGYPAPVRCINMISILFISVLNTLNSIVNISVYYWVKSETRTISFLLGINCLLVYVWSVLTARG